MADKKQTASKKKSDPKLPAKMGRPRTFQDEAAFQARYEDYIKHCYDTKMMPTKAGFCAFARMTRETYYKQQDYFSDTFHAIDLCLEDFAANQHAFTGIGSLPNALQYSRYAYGWDKAASAYIDSNLSIDFDADDAEIDNLMSKLGYLPKPDDPESE